MIDQKELADLKKIESKFEKIFTDSMEINLSDFLPVFEKSKPLPIAYFLAYKNFQRLFNPKNIEELNKVLQGLCEKNELPEVDYIHPDFYNPIKPIETETIGAQIKVTFASGRRFCGFIFISLADFQNSNTFLTSFHSQFRFTGERLSKIFLMPGININEAPKWLINCGFQIHFD